MTASIARKQRRAGLQRKPSQAATPGELAAAIMDRRKRLWEASDKLHKATGGCRCYKCDGPLGLPGMTAISVTVGDKKVMACPKCAGRKS